MACIECVDCLIYKEKVAARHNPLGTVQSLRTLFQATTAVKLIDKRQQHHHKL